MFACCILHNMILDDEHEFALELPFDMNWGVPLHWGLSFDEVVASTLQVENQDVH